MPTKKATTKATSKKKSKSDTQIVKLEKRTRELLCKLTETELLKAAQELAKIIQNIEAEEDRQSSLRQDLKARMTKLESNRTILANKISRREEYRDIEVEPEKNFELGIYRERRKDTGDWINERDLSGDDYQTELPN